MSIDAACRAHSEYCKVMRPIRDIFGYCKALTRDYGYVAADLSPNSKIFLLPVWG